MSSGRSFKGPLLTTGLGVILIILSVGLWFVSIAQLGRSVDALVVSGESLREELLVEGDAPGAVSVDLARGEHVVYLLDFDYLAAPGSTTTTTSELGPSFDPGSTGNTRQQIDEAANNFEISVTGPSGEVATRSPSVGDYISAASSVIEVFPVWVFRVDRPGEYTVNIDLAGIDSTAAGIDKFGVGARSDIDAATSAGVRSVGIFVAALVAAAIGGLLLLIGLIWLLVVGLSGPKVPPGGYGPGGYGTQPAYGSPGYGSQPGYGPQGGYGPPGGHRY